ncbi:hypothetical protein BDV39DRAFT_181662 [Aspergillus sergii]|uniref:Uncharacterized protein n=1 Tax=Aspergillus sergii TaxID=1034303 RepID=A0A5N6WS61_9EURO|nr:hypothetical protein BDV39DRAFT_181662 [Aspergillus sergii]
MSRMPSSTANVEYAPTWIPPLASETKDEDTQRIGVAKFVQDVIIHSKEERAMGPIVPVVGVTNVDLGIVSNHGRRLTTGLRGKGLASDRV